MKKLAILLVCTILTLGSMAQFFNNSNSELCMKLYTVRDGAGEYMVYMVIEEWQITEEDVKVMKRWNETPQSQRTTITSRWSREGRRIEVIRPPYVMDPPIFPGDLPYPELVVRKPEKLSYDPWKKPSIQRGSGRDWEREFEEKRKK